MRGRLLVAALVVAGALGSASAASAADTISASCTTQGQTAPCTSKWYGSPVELVWNTTSTTEQPTSCAFDVEVPFTADTTTQVSCSATFADTGQSVTATVPLNVEVSTPTATATPARPPDSNGWYNHPVAVTFSGSAFSGIAGCTAPQTYSGPDTASTTITGSCTDNAGKVAPAGLAIPYDATPPTISLSASPAPDAVSVDWTAAATPAPLSSVQVVRSPGHATAPSSVIATGATGAVQDTDVRPGVAYTYTLTAVDAAGNTASQTVSATPVKPKTRVARHGGAQGPLLRWRAVRGASYYNLQLYRGHKLLSVWPPTAHYRLRHSWRYRGRRRTLAPGRYRWYVWPGFGPRSRDRYGRLAGSGTLVIR